MINLFVSCVDVSLVDLVLEWYCVGCWLVDLRCYCVIFAYFFRVSHCHCITVVHASLECHTISQILSKGTHNNRERGGTREAPRTKTNTRESGVVPISFDSFLKIAGAPYKLRSNTSNYNYYSYVQIADLAVARGTIPIVTSNSLIGTTQIHLPNISFTPSP